MFYNKIVRLSEPLLFDCEPYNLIKYAYPKSVNTFVSKNELVIHRVPSVIKRTCESDSLCSHFGVW